MPKPDWNHVNPATGPVYIEGAKPGDILRVDLLEVKVGKQASMVTIPGEGALGDTITKMETAILKLEGELFGAGDFHAAMGDGEIGVCGAEISGELHFKAQVVDSLKGLPTPFVQTPNAVATLYSAPTLDEAARCAIHRMAQFLT